MARITNFGGIIPLLANRRLPGESAREASNVNLLPGELRPLRKSRLRWEPSAATSLASFYRVDDSTWFGWPAAGVDMQLTAIEGTARYAYTGDGIPKITTKALGTPVSPAGQPAAARALGIPTPSAAPGVSHAGGTGSAATRFYAVTFYSDWNEESAPSPVSAAVVGKVDGTWSITGLPATPPNTGSVSAASHSSGTVTVTIGAHYNRAGESISFTGVAGMTDLNGTWTIASVPSSTQVAISLTTAQTYTSGGTWTRTNPWGACTKRLYRTSGTLATFQLVAEGITGTSYSDTLTDAQILGDDLVSSGWVPPPVDLIGLVSLSGGVLAGWLSGGRTVCFSEPYQPHAWPTRYRMKVPDEIVGIAAFDTSLGVATKGAPVILAGQEPGQMSPLRFPQPMPALSRFSVCSVENGFLYASKNGMVRVDLSGPNILTRDLFTPEGWNALSPSTMRCAYDGARIVLSTTVNKRAYLMGVGGGALVTVAQSMDALSGDPVTGDLHYAFANGVYRFDSFDTAPMVFDWWSMEYVLPKPQAFGVAKIETDPTYTAEATAAIAAEREEVRAANQAAMSSVFGGRGGIGARAINDGAINGSNLDQVPDSAVAVSFSFYIGETLLYSVTVPNGEPFGLPAGYRTDAFSVRVQANTQIRAVLLSDTPGNLSKS